MRVRLSEMADEGYAFVLRESGIGRKINEILPRKR